MKHLSALPSPTGSNVSTTLSNLQPQKRGHTQANPPSQH